MKFELVDNAKQAWRWISVQCMVASAALQGAWVFMPDDLKAGLNPKLVSGVAMVLLLVGVIGRLKKQDGESKP